ncbi:MAG TPA: ATPase, T2SS/T4P/T4SS family, partial [Gammaproteobacteria bacterium]|nr:ATPase, T2SS/T4P/T4SS family [Gammaproteobacteria bacterium]
MASQQNINISGLARKLVQAEVLDEQSATIAVEQSTRLKSPFVQHLVENNLAHPQKIAVIASAEFGIPLLDLNVIDLDVLPKELVSEKLIRQHHALPLFKRGNRLYVGMSDPTNLQALDEFKFHTGISTEAIIVEEDKLAEGIERILSARDASALSNLEDTNLDDLDITSIEDDETRDEMGDSDVDDAPIVRFVNKVLLDAINKGASDIHFEPYEKMYRVRFRQDGILYEFANPPVNL